MTGSSIIFIGAYILIRVILRDLNSSDEVVDTRLNKSKKEMIYLIENNQIFTNHEFYYYDFLQFDNSLRYCNKHLVKKQYNKVIRNNKINPDMALRARNFLVDRAEYLIHLN